MIPGPGATGGSLRLAGRVVVVTGAAQGQGAAEVVAAVAEGATVVRADVKELPVLDDLGAGVHDRQLEVADEAGWAELASWTKETLGRVDGLVNNAGMTSRVRLGEVDLAEWNRVLEVNLTGPMLGMQALMPLMSEGASIVNVGSIAALTGHYTAAYTASKWALRGLTKVAATELGPRGIRANAIHPGFIETPMTATAPSAFRRINEELTPLERTGTPEEVASAVVFLLSAESSFLNGVDLAIDGGMSGGGLAKAISDALRDEAS